MKYFLIVGEASGDLHASNLMKALLDRDPDAQFMYVGGEKMRAVGGTCVARSEDLAYMGVIDVLLHYGDIHRGGVAVQAALLDFRPDVVVCVDYAGFNFRYILPYVKEKLPATKVVYYIPPKVWAWKKSRIATLRSRTDLVLCIFPFEVDFFAKHRLPQAKYIGNPSLDTIRDFERSDEVDGSSLPEKYIALLPGSRKSEIRANLPVMLEAAKAFPDYKVVIAGAPGASLSLYLSIPGVEKSDILFGETYQVVRYARVALVTSGTATLETALLGTPQVVCYAVRGGGLANFVFKHFFSVSYISLVNLIADREVVSELFGGLFRLDRIILALRSLLADGTERVEMLSSYAEVRRRLHTPHYAATTAAEEILALLR